MKRLLLFILLVAPVAAQAQPVPSPFGIDPRTLMAPITFPASAVNGGGVVTSPQLLVPDGTALLPGVAFNSQPAFGWYRVSAGILGIGDTVGNTGVEYINANGWSLSSTRAYSWAAGSDPSAVDTQLLRNAAGVVGVTTGFRAAFYTSPASSVLTINTNVIVPTTSVHHLGAGLVKTITVPASCANTCSIDIVPDAAFTTDATGNISLASTAVISRTLRFTWDGTKWNPSY